MDRERFVKEQWVPCGAIYPLEIPAWRAVDIHDWADFRQAEAFTERAGL